MSGCAHCVYDLYLEDFQLYMEQLTAARGVVLAKGTEATDDDDWPEELGTREVNEEGGDRKAQAAKALEKAYSGLDPSMRAFLEMEARLKKKQLDAG